MGIVAVAMWRGAVRTDGLVRATLPVVGYFALLLVTAAWAAFPRETLKWLVVDSIEGVVFVLFFLAARNVGGRAMAAGMVSVIVPAVVLAAVEVRDDPFVPRFGGYSPVLLPLVMAFGAAGVAMSRRTWPYLAAMGVAFALLLAGRSRAPLAAAMLAIALSAMAFGPSRRDRIRNAIGAIAAAIVIALLLAVIPVTRPMMITMVLRVARLLPPNGVEARLRSEIRGTPYALQVRPRDQVGVRALIGERAVALARASFPLGIGYMNFQMHFERRYGFKASLHSMYTAWFLEGGLAVAVYVAVCGWRFVRGLWLAARAARTVEELACVKAILVGLAAMLFLGAFHQIHQSPALWLLLGLGNGVREKRPSP